MICRLRRGGVSEEALSTIEAPHLILRPLGGRAIRSMLLRPCLPRGTYDGVTRKRRLLVGQIQQCVAGAPLAEWLGMV